MDSVSLARTILDSTAQTVHVESRGEVLQAAIRYAGLRAAWSMTPVDERARLDVERTRAHNSLIDSFNILSRAMGRDGEDNNWRHLLGSDRRIIGDVACHIHCVLALAAA